jgi:hypothetical protein
MNSSAVPAPDANNGLARVRQEVPVDRHLGCAEGACGLMVLTLAEGGVSAISWFGERSLLSHFDLPRTLPN